MTVHPLRLLETWLADAEASGQSLPWSVAFVTATADGVPSARTVTLKRVEDDALIFTSALWTRKAREIDANPRVALLFHWPALGRQVHISAVAEHADRALAHELFDERDLPNRWQALVSRQGEPIDDLERLRQDLSTRTAGLEEPQCPTDWGALRLRPTAAEFWTESPDRLHERRMFVRQDDDWSETLLAP